MTARPTSVVDHMSQPSLMHEPTDPVESKPQLVDADEFDRLLWGTKVEYDRARNRIVGKTAMGEVIETELDRPVTA